MDTTDVYCEWGGDFILTANGSIQFATGWPQAREKIIRIILTNASLTLPDGSMTAPDYIFDTSFGESAGALIDQNPTKQYMQGCEQRITAAIMAAGLSDTQPTVSFSQPALGVFQVTVSVVYAGTPQSVGMTMGRGMTS